MDRFKVATVAATLVVMLVTVLPSALPAGTGQVRKDKFGVPIPDIQIMTTQFMDRAEPDPQGEIQPLMVRVSVRNNTDRAIVGILWKITIKDAKTNKVIEVLHPYTAEDNFSAVNRMKITPHATVEVPFYIVRKVHTDHTRESTVDVDNYAYKAFDKEHDRPVSIELYATEPWPFKGRTGPVLVTAAQPAAEKAQR